MKVDSWCKVSKDEISELKKHMLEDKLTVANPEYVKNEQMGFSNRGVKRHQKVYKEIGNELWIPRALAHSVSRDYEDERVEGKEIDFKSQIELGPNDNRQEDQTSFVNDILAGLENSMGCVGQAEAGFGKTVCALETIARLGRKTAVLVHKTFLLDQWKERILEFYDIEPSEIGIVHAGNDRADWKDKKIVIMLCQSLLSSRDYPKAMYESFGTVVIDECFSDDTEILTEDGWVYFKDLEKGQKVGQYSEDGVKFVEPLRHIEYEHSGKMVSISGRQVDLLVTPNHDQSYVKKLKSGEEVLSKEKAKDMKFYYDKWIPMAGIKNSGKARLTAVERLLIAIQADGYIYPDSNSNGRYSGSKQVSITIKKDRKIKRLRKILQKCEFKYSENKTTGDKTRFLIQIPIEYPITKDFRKWVDLTQVSGKWGAEFIDELSRWDGHRGKKYPNRPYYSSTVPENVDVVQAIAAISGFKCTRSVQVDDRKKSYKDVHRLWMWEDPLKTTQSLTKEFVDYSGKVYCVEVPSGHVIVRRNGCVSVSGNCHRFAAKEFRKTIVKFPAKYRLGVTATPERRDGMEDVFFWHIGDIAAKGSKRKIKPRVVMVDTKIPVTRLQKRNLTKNGSIGWSTMITYLTERDDRNRKLAKELFKALKSGRKILALSDRRDHLRELSRLVKIMMKKYDERFTIGFYVGGTDKMERTIAAGRDLVFGTYQMAEEGLDIPALDTLFLMTPRSAVEQAVGRILRQHDSKKEPLVVDFVDTAFYLAQGVARKREQQYKELGYMK